MVKVSLESRNKAPDSRTFYYMHTAKTWLLLAGYLPSESDESIYINLYTRDTAHVTLYR